MIGIESILAKCIHFNRYQIVLLLLFCIINILSALHYYSQTIISFVPDHWCFNETFKNTSEFLTEMRGKESSCKSSVDGNETCTNFVYDRYMGYESLTTELNWVCSLAWKLTLGQSMFFVGSVIGTFSFGVLADTIGRIPVLILSNLMAMIGNLLTVFTTSVTSFCVFRFVSGLATDTNFVMMYILVLEYIKPSFRTVGLSICIGIFYCLGSMAAPWIAVAAKSWKTFLIVTSFPFVFVPLIYFIVPESIQWLIAKGKYEQAADSVKRIARINKKVVDEADINKNFEEHRLKSENDNNERIQPSVLDLFKTPRLRRNTLILLFKSIVITLSYDAVSRNVQGKGISPFVMFSLSAMTIFPACLVLILLQDKIGRKAMSSISLLMSGTFISASGILLSYQQVNENNVPLLVLLSIIGRFGVTVAYNCGAQYATELIPTCVRGQGIAAVHVIGYGFTFLSAYILYSRIIFTAMPELILGLMSFFGSFLCLFLPETTNRTLPNTLEDGENFGKDEGVFTFNVRKKD